MSVRRKCDYVKDPSASDPRECKDFSLVWVSMLTEYTGSINYSFLLPKDCHRGQLPCGDTATPAPLQRLTGLPLWSAVYNKQAELLNCWCISIRVHSPPDPGFSGPMSVIFFILHCPGQINLKAMHVFAGIYCLTLRKKHYCQIQRSIQIVSPKDSLLVGKT